MEEKKPLNEETTEEILKEDIPEEATSGEEEIPCEEDDPCEEAAENEAAEQNVSEEAVEQAEATDEQENVEDAETDTPLFGKKKKKDKKDEKIEELTDRVQRQMAEFDNFRKRTEKEKSQMFEVGAKSILEKLLPVVDNFERGLAAISDEEKESSVASGMDMIYKQLTAMLEECGVKPIEAEGQPFDPDFHNAVMHIEDEAYGENVVAQELQKGYMYHDTVLRYSMVQVAN